MVLTLSDVEERICTLLLAVTKHLQSQDTTLHAITLRLRPIVNVRTKVGFIIIVHLTK
jgi:hypothetical protein